ncbi:ABC-type Fe3+-siderophore transport system [Commensalibacter communis]|uniref:Permease component (FepD) n=1 Tax=Commensalibacter communis TaxID=2972786 RepID=A0A9W4X6D0_9PROT|nr:iron ABC transporter permease [Commensalibacter communis]CAI3928225.1 ABC-type Fe3+-siderophore transport system [Commensalibacter communis]CAI3928802.1 ABC-type Fe3+-siderophore transport system [Commensalibacter communis]CAI3932661.1 ABC-type Fe3+-siderophore transport system [Commensalibacter communis]CAI3934199.1 ABC-type Fe3+-siderophore transport system [Commensalibacter communis]
MDKRYQVYLAILLLVLIGSIIGAANIGPVHLPWSALLNADPQDMDFQIWTNIRLPRILLAVIIGIALSVSGTVMQGLFRNPLADPGLLGISSGAGLAVAIALVIPLGLPAFLSLWVPVIAAFIGSLLVTLLIYQLSGLTKGNLSSLLLIGIAINALGGAAVGILSWVSNDQQLRQLSLWGMGSLGQTQWPLIIISMCLIIPTIVLIQCYAKQLNLLQLGEEDAHYLGINVHKTQRQLLILSALLVGTAVSISGIIGFLGLVIPNAMRLIFGNNHKVLLPASALSGAILLLVADTIARTMVQPAEMPVGLLTSLLGGPWFFWLILKEQWKRRS